MEVLLTKDVAGVGHAGEVKKVNDGYARNYLIPKKLAIVAKASVLKQAESIKDAHARREAKTREEVQQLAGTLAKTVVQFRAKAGESDRLFGSITSTDIADALARDHHINVDRRKILLEDPLKHIGEYSIGIKLHPEVVAQLTVRIERLTEV
jgi:large subunit ribosomal protein L9